MPRTMTEEEMKRIYSLGGLKKPCANGWRSIETAPKDGTSILLYGVWKGEVSKNPEYRDIFKAAYSFDEWVVCDSDIYGPIVLDPTHWMPLPDIPNEV